jgi:hypothetical protein
MQLRSGACFAPYYLKRILHSQATSENPISTRIDVKPLVQCAVALEDARFERGEDDSEGLGVASRSPSPLTDLESDGEAGVSGQPRPSSELQSGAKKRRSAGANRRRARKRVRLATSGHQPHAYAARPSTAMYRAEEQKPLRVPEDASDFPASESGSWVGLRKSGAKKEPWSVSDLVENSFTFIEWDGL